MNHNKLEKIKELFQGFHFISDEPSPIFKGVIPNEIMSEIDYFVSQCQDLRKQENSFLLHHSNAGDNSFQISVPPQLFESSLTMGFIIALAEIMHSKLHKVDLQDLRDTRILRVKRHPGHYSDYDFWVNFSNKGDSAPIHNHTGYFSGVIYVSGLEGTKTFFDNGMSVEGCRGDVVLFKSHLPHWVEKRTFDYERVTIAFNIDACF